MPDRRERDRLRGVGQVVRHPHQPERVDEIGVRGEIPDPRAGQGEGLAHRPGDDEQRPALEQGHRARRAGPGELGVGLVHDHQRLGAASTTPLMTSRERAVPVGLLGEQRKTMRLVLTDLPHGEVRVEVEDPGRGALQPVDPRGSGRAGDDRVHRVRRREPERGPPHSPNAWTRCSSTSFEPLPAHTWSGATSMPVWEREGMRRGPRAAR